MIAQLKRLFLFAAMLALPVSSFAAAPSGTLIFRFNTNNAPLWDLSGSYEFTQQLIGVDGRPVDVTFGITITQDDRGRISGNEVTIVSVGGNLVGGEYKVHGKVTGEGGFARLRMHVHIVANGLVVGVDVTRAVFDIDYDAETDMSGGLNGTSKGKATFSTLGSGRITSEFSTMVPSGMGGAWVLTVNVLPLKSLPGSGTAVFPSGRIQLLDVNGSYSNRRDETLLRLRGVGPSNGVKFKIMLDGASGLQWITGKSFGQKISFLAD